jgi:hypothetical protein
MLHLLKTDTEGHDLKVLEGAEQMLDEGRIQAVYSESTKKTLDTLIFVAQA